MKTFALNKNSWHYRLASEYGGLHRWQDSTDICSYTKEIFKGLFILALMLVAVAVVSQLVVHLVLGIGFSIYAGMWIGSDWAWAAATILVVAVGYIVILLAFSLTCKGGKIAKETISNTEFFKVAYSSWKDKYCARIEFKE